MLNREWHRSPFRGSLPRSAAWVLVILAGGLWSACGTTVVQSDTVSVGDTPALETEDSATSPPGPAELWAFNCARCHNAQPPRRFSDAQWDIVVHHMRLRCNLTGEEQRSIRRFLQSANN